MTQPINLTPQTGPAEVITLEQFWSRLQKGSEVHPTMFVLVPVARLIAAQGELDKLKAALRRSEELAESRRAIIDRAKALFWRGPQSRDSQKEQEPHG